MKKEVFLLKLSRCSAWLLLLGMLTFFVSGYSMVYKYGMDKLLNVNVAVALHTKICFILLALFVIHAGIQTFFALKRWKVI